jgi:hypothetical protein
MNKQTRNKRNKQPDEQTNKQNPGIGTVEF